jgi:hypothetical protein
MNLQIVILQNKWQSLPVRNHLLLHLKCEQLYIYIGKNQILQHHLICNNFQHTGLAVVLQGLVRPRLRGTELEFWRNSEEARTDRPSQQLRSLNGEWRLMRYFLLTHLCGISHRIWCTLSTICSDAA